MGLNPDFGAALAERGMTSGTTLQCSPSVDNCGTADGKTFSCTVALDWEGQPHAVTFDLDRPVLDQFIMACPPSIAMNIAEALNSPTRKGWTIRFDQPVVVSIEGRLGTKQPLRSGRSFVPILVASVMGQTAGEALSACLALVAIGREGAPIFDGTVDDDEHLGKLRRRVVAIGRVLDRQGGIELMRKAYEGAMRFLAQENIFIGRWVEAVWDGIGDWRG